MCSGKETMHLSVRWRVDCLPMDVPEDETVFGLKCHISERVANMPPEYQLLLFKGAFLEDPARLQGCGVAHGSVLHMVPNKGVMENMKRSHSNVTLHSLNSNPRSMSIGDLRFHTALNSLREEDLALSHQRQLDIRMNQIEMKPGGFGSIVTQWRQLCDFWERQCSPQRRYQPAPTIIPSKPDGPCEDPLPVPWTV